MTCRCQASGKIPTFSRWHKPYDLQEFRKASTIQAVKVPGPFKVDTQEGEMVISPETCDDFGDGYWIAYPSDGSKPYGIADSFMLKNYVPIEKKA